VTLFDSLLADADLDVPGDAAQQLTVSEVLVTLFKSRRHDPVEF